MIWLVRLLRLLAGGSLITAGLGKLLADKAVRLAPVILRSASGPVMLASTVIEDALPALEIIAGIAFLTGIGCVSRTVLGLLLGTLFVVVALMVPAGVRCGCMGIFGGFESPPGHIAVSVGLLAILVILATLELRTRRSALRAR